MAGSTVKRRRSVKPTSARKRGRASGAAGAEGDAAVQQYVRALKDGGEHILSSDSSSADEELSSEAVPKDVEPEDGVRTDVRNASDGSSSSESEIAAATGGSDVTSAPTGKAADTNAVLPVDAKDDHPNVHVTILLESANLEAVKLPGSRGGHALLSSDEHGTMLRKMKRDPNDARPDITHQCLLTLLDSPLNKAGKLTVYIRTKRNVLITVHPQTRIPRTIRRFSGLMVELLQRLKVRSTNGTEPLLQVIRNPIVSHLPAGQRRVVCTYNCDSIVDVRAHAGETIQKAAAERASVSASLEKNLKHEERQDADAAAAEAKDPLQVLYVIGAMAHGKVDVDWADEEICMSEYPLSAATVCSRITFTYECMMGIL